VKLNARSILEQLNETQIELLTEFATALRDRAIPLGLVAGSDADRIWDRHVLDSLRGLACMRAEDRAALDIGSGAGLPGIPLAIALPSVSFVLVEPRRRRAAFLESVSQQLGLGNVSVAPLRADQAGSGVGLSLARALAPPEKSWRMAAPLLSPTGRLVYWAGRTWGDDEIEQLNRLGVKVKICSKPEFQWQGPLVIMIRSFTSSPEGP
jgi:16S rRNA (guanine527-N7)-methyltransferase